MAGGLWTVGLYIYIYIYISIFWTLLPDFVGPITFFQGVFLFAEVCRS